MKQICVFFVAAVAAVSCHASAVSDGVNAEVLKSIVPAEGDSVVASPYSAVFMSGLFGDGMDNRELRIALSEKMGVRTTEFGPTFMRIRTKLEEQGSTNRVEVLFANSLWMRNYARLEREFHPMAYRVYDVAFGPLVGVDPVNAWNSAKTDGLIAKVADELDMKCDTVVVSAAGFNGAWARMFPPARQGVFHAKGGDVQLPMMEDTRSVSMVKRPAYTAFSLPYRGNNLFLYALVPNDGKTPREILDAMTADEFDILDRALLPGYKPDDARGDPLPDVEGASVAVAKVVLPKFRVETSLDFMPALAKLGVPKTGFDTICKGLSIGMALQHNVFETSETGGEVGKVDLPEVKAEGETPRLACDRPFAFIVRTDDHLTLLAGFFGGK